MDSEDLENYADESTEGGDWVKSGLEGQFAVNGSN